MSESDIELEISIKDAPTTCKSFMWQHFGYQVEKINGNKVTSTDIKFCVQVCLG